jgi:hypothetical protein
MIIMFISIIVAGIAVAIPVTTARPTPPGPGSSAVPGRVSNSVVEVLGTAGVDVNLFRSSEPAPMGIADYGVGSNGSYKYSTNESLGEATIYSLQTQNLTGDTHMSFQLNVNLVFTSNHALRVYWVQDVVRIDTSTGYAFFLDNVWNSSSRTATMSGSAISGNGQVTTYSGGKNFYYDVANQYGISISLPASISFLVTSQVNSLGQPTVTFEYDTGSGFQSYDNVTFVSVSRLTSLTGFEVNGFNYNPYGTFYDSELVMGGACCGYNVTDLQSDVRLTLYYWNGHNFQTVSNAYNFGSDTAEGASNAKSLGFYTFAAGTLYSEIQPGSGTLGKLYFQSQIGTIDIRTSIGSGTLYVSNATNPSATPAQYPFVGGEVRVALAPGRYLLQIYQSGVSVDQGAETVEAGQTLALQTPLGDIQIKMSDSVVGGGGFSPVLTYTRGGVQVTATLTSTPTVYFMDPGTSWSVTGSTTGATERWVTVQPTTGIASSSQTIQLTYYHQYLVIFSYVISGGGTPESGPVVQCLQLGLLTSSTAGTATWTDAGSHYSLTNPLPGSTFSERWDANVSSGKVGASGTITTTYYHQFTVAVSYRIVGGGNPVLPSASGTEFGSPFTTQLGSQNETVWFDSGTNWNVTNPLAGSTSQERWQSAGTLSGTTANAWSISVTYFHQYALNLSSSITGGGNPTTPTFSSEQYGQPFSVTFAAQVTDFFDAGSNWTVPILLGGSTSNERWSTTDATSGVVVGQSTIQVNYHHQFLVGTSLGPSSGGSITNSPGWYDSGTNVELNATANGGWRFEGWAGVGSGAYTGSLSQTSVQINAPVTENATFYPGLEITSGSNGGVSYRYGSQSGTVLAGTSQTIYAPVGTVISLGESPSSVFYQFGGWSPSSAGTSGATTVNLQAPSSISASFSVNIVIVAGIIGVVAGVALAGVFALERRKNRLPKP